MSQAPRPLILGVTLAFSLGITFVIATAGAATPGDNPLVQRQALMDATAAAAALAGGMLKGEIPYERTAAKSAITTFWAVSRNYGHLFPAGSDTGDTDAAASIWTDRAGFNQQLAKFTTHVDAAKQVSGKEGPADLATFKDAVTPVLATCKACHRDYRIQD